MKVVNTQPLRVAIIGYGKFGEFIASALHSSTSVQLVAIVDNHFQSIGQKNIGGNLVKVFPNANDIFSNPEIDVVHIATPPASHFDLAMAALQAGKHVVVEKPLALLPSQGKELLATAARNQRTLAISFILRYNPIIRALQAIVRKDLFDHLRCIRMENIAQQVPPGHWFWDIQQSGGIHIEHGVHFFDAVSYVLGSAAQHIEGSLVFREGKNMDAYANIIYTNGVLAHFYHGFLVTTDLEHTRWLVVWDQATAVIEGWIPLTMRIEGKIDSHKKEYLSQLGFEVEKIASNKSRATLVLPDEKQAVYADCVRRLWEDVAGAIRNNTEVAANGAAGLESLTTAWQASQHYRSVDTGSTARPITLSAAP